MSIVTGFLCVFFFLLLSAKALTGKFHLKKADRFLQKLHKPAALLLLIFCLLHFFTALPLFRTRNVFVPISGLCIFLFIVLLIVLCHMGTGKQDTKNTRFTARPLTAKNGLYLHRMFTLLIAVAILFHMGIYYIDFAAYQSKIAAITIENTDFSQINDGIYVGEYDAGYIYAKVQVTVEKGVITDLTLLEHRNERGTAAEAILPSILEYQSLSVDTVSGATNSGLVIKAAIQDALHTSQTR